MRLKGRNGLGLEFYTPFQNTLNNYDYNGSQDFTAYSSIDIVATEDSTEIIITPSIDVLGKLAGIPDTILLEPWTNLFSESKRPFKHRTSCWYAYKIE